MKTRNGKKFIIDPGYLACDHHIYMTVGVQLALQLINNKSATASIIGLGGGGLCTFLHKCFPKLFITAIDIDSEMLIIAQKHFDLICDDKLKVHIQDGLSFLCDARKNGKYNTFSFRYIIWRTAKKLITIFFVIGEKFDLILFDVDSKDVSVGMSCPPKEFVDENVLSNVSCCLNDKGMITFNIYHFDLIINMFIYSIFFNFRVFHIESCM